MTTVTVDAQVAAPIERVFAVFTDLEHGAERVSNIQKIEVLTTGGFALGTRWLETRDVLGQLGLGRDGSDSVRAEPHLHHHASQGGRADRYGVHVRAFPGQHQGSDRVRPESHGLPPGLLAPLAWAIAGKVRDVLSRDLADLKASMEEHN